MAQKNMLCLEISQIICLLAKEEEFKFVLINKDAEGVSVNETTFLIKQDQCEIEFKDVQVDKENMMIELDGN